MQRISVVERPGLKAAAEEHGYEFREGEGVPCWDETVYYQFTLSQIEDDLEKPADEIAAMCSQLLGQIH